MPTNFDDVLARNIRVARSRKRLGQAAVVARMRALGYEQWHRQTLGKVERGERRAWVGELPGLALALDVSIAALIDPELDDESVELPGGLEIDVTAVQASIRFQRDRGIQWDDDNRPYFEASPESLARQHGTVPAGEAAR